MLPSTWQKLEYNKINPKAIGYKKCKQRNLKWHFNRLNYIQLSTQKKGWFEIQDTHRQLLPDNLYCKCEQIPICP